MTEADGGEGDAMNGTDEGRATSGAGEDAATRADDPPDGERVVVLNPVSGGGNNDGVRDLAERRGYAVRETEGRGDAARLAGEAAAAGATTVVAAGGDGTVHQVANGLDRAGALDAVTFGVVPAGTGNNFAGNLGVTGVEHAFDVLDDGEVRRIDVGTLSGTPADGDADGVFLNSVIGGLTAEASGETTPELKRRFGALAYVLTTLRTAAAFEALPLTVETTAGGRRRTAWSGEAAFAFVGNGRRFPVRGRTQGNVEDGLLEVTIVEEMPARDLVEEAALQRLLGRDTPHVTRLRSPSVDVTVRGDDPVSFSLDGEMAAYDRLSLGARERVLSVAVGEEYEPDPDGED